MPMLAYRRCDKTDHNRVETLDRCCREADEEHRPLLTPHRHIVENLAHIPLRIAYAIHRIVLDDRSPDSGVNLGSPASRHRRHHTFVKTGDGFRLATSLGFVHSKVKESA